MDKRTCKRAAKKLVDELVNGIKTTSSKNVNELFKVVKRSGKKNK